MPDLFSLLLFFQSKSYSICFDLITVIMNNFDYRYSDWCSCKGHRRKKVIFFDIVIIQSALEVVSNTIVQWISPALHVPGSKPICHIKFCHQDS